MSFLKHSILLDQHEVTSCYGYNCASDDEHKHCPASAGGSSGIGYCCIPEGEYGASKPDSCTGTHCWKYMNAANCASLRNGDTTTTTETAAECANYNDCIAELEDNFTGEQLDEYKNEYLDKLKEKFGGVAWPPETN